MTWKSLVAKLSSIVCLALLSFALMMSLQAPAIAAIVYINGGCTANLPPPYGFPIGTWKKRENIALCKKVNPPIYPTGTMNRDRCKSQVGTQLSPKYYIPGNGEICQWNLP
ncbi:MAG: hypothetical protein F6K16_35215 [Symploca sp. SIO2B6]|nr:hypothetical protein [Symploca sp. SIO2B6]